MASDGSMTGRLSVSTTAAASELLRTKFGVYERSSDGRSIVRASDYELPASVASAVSACLVRPFLYGLRCWDERGPMRAETAMEGAAACHRLRRM